VDPDHGLWGFFHSKEKPMNTPEEDAAHGRPWKPEDLRRKNWEDLHALWWVCAKELNILATEGYERARVKAGYGDSEAGNRRKRVSQLFTFRWFQQIREEQSADCFCSRFN
jgi:large subunit ribosomal protein L47